MKKKLTTLLFGLLLAVGWTSSVSAQSVVHNKAYYDALTYKWTDADGVTHESKSTDLATDPYQIYELLRFVYGNPAFPGPKYGAYTSSFVREDPISYDPIQGGWNITAATAVNRDITINVTTRWSGYPVYIKSIIIKSNNEEITRLEYTDGMSNYPDGWTSSPALSPNNNGELYFNNNTSGTITVSSTLLEGYSDVEVIINARSADTDYYGYSISVNNSSQQLASNSLSNYTWNVTLPEEGAFVQGTVQTPSEEGYTALIVSVKDDAKPAST